MNEEDEETVELTKLEDHLWGKAEDILEDNGGELTTTELREKMLEVQEDGSVIAPKRYRGKEKGLQRVLNMLRKKLEEKGEIRVEEVKTSGRIPAKNWILTQ